MPEGYIDDRSRSGAVSRTRPCGIPGSQGRLASPGCIALYGTTLLFLIDTLSMDATAESAAPMSLSMHASSRAKLISYNII